MGFGEWIAGNGGCVIVDRLVIPDTDIVSTDCRTMTIAADGPDIEIGWVHNLKDSPNVITIAGVNLGALTEQIAVYPGSPGGSTLVSCRLSSGDPRSTHR